MDCVACFLNTFLSALPPIVICPYKVYQCSAAAARGAKADGAFEPKADGAFEPKADGAFEPPWSTKGEGAQVEY